MVGNKISGLVCQQLRKSGSRAKWLSLDHFLNTVSKMTKKKHVQEEFVRSL